VRTIFKYSMFHLAATSSIFIIFRCIICLKIMHIDFIIQHNTILLIHVIEDLSLFQFFLLSLLQKTPIFQLLIKDLSLYNSCLCFKFSNSICCFLF